MSECEAGRLTESERRRLLRLFDELAPAIPVRPQREADEEIANIREARRRGGRRTVDKREEL